MTTRQYLLNSNAKTKVSKSVRTKNFLVPRVCFSNFQLRLGLSTPSKMSTIRSVKKKKPQTNKSRRVASTYLYIKRTKFPELIKINFQTRYYIVLKHNTRCSFPSFSFALQVFCDILYEIYLCRYNSIYLIVFSNELG